MLNIKKITLLTSVFVCTQPFFSHAYSSVSEPQYQYDSLKNEQGDVIGEEFKSHHEHSGLHDSSGAHIGDEFKSPPSHKHGGLHDSVGAHIGDELKSLTPHKHGGLHDSSGAHIGDELRSPPSHKHGGLHDSSGAHIGDELKSLTPHKHGGLHDSSGAHIGDELRSPPSHKHGGLHDSSGAHIGDELRLPSPHEHSGLYDSEGNHIGDEFNSAPSENEVFYDNLGNEITLEFDTRVDPLHNPYLDLDNKRQEDGPGRIVAILEQRDPYLFYPYTDKIYMIDEKFAIQATNFKGIYAGEISDDEIEVRAKKFELTYPVHKRNLKLSNAQTREELESYIAASNLLLNNFASIANSIRSDIKIIDKEQRFQRSQGRHDEVERLQTYVNKLNTLWNYCTEEGNLISRAERSILGQFKCGNKTYYSEEKFLLESNMPNEIDTQAEDKSQGTDNRNSGHISQGTDNRNSGHISQGTDNRNSGHISQGTDNRNSGHISQGTDNRNSGHVSEGNDNHNSGETSEGTDDIKSELEEAILINQQIEEERVKQEVARREERLENEKEIARIREEAERIAAKWQNENAELNKQLLAAKNQAVIEATIYREGITKANEKIAAANIEKQRAVDAIAAANKEKEEGNVNGIIDFETRARVSQKIAEAEHAKAEAEKAIAKAKEDGKLAEAKVNEANEKIARAEYAIEEAKNQQYDYSEIESVDVQAQSVSGNAEHFESDPFENEAISQALGAAIASVPLFSVPERPISIGIGAAYINEKLAVSTGISYNFKRVNVKLLGGYHHDTNDFVVSTGISIEF